MNGLRCVLWALGGHALHAVLYLGGHGGRTLFAERVECAGRAGGDALHAALYAGGVEVG